MHSAFSPSRAALVRTDSNWLDESISTTRTSRFKVRVILGSCSIATLSVGSVGLMTRPTRAIPGTMSFNSSRRFAISASSLSVQNPVTLPPGLARLAASGCSHYHRNGPCEAMGGSDGGDRAGHDRIRFEANQLSGQRGQLCNGAARVAYLDREIAAFRIVKVAKARPQCIEVACERYSRHRRQATT